MATTKIQDLFKIVRTMIISLAQIYHLSSFIVNKFQKNQTYCIPNWILSSTHPWKATGEQITKIFTKCHPLWLSPFMAAGLLQSIRKACSKLFVLIWKEIHSDQHTIEKVLGEGFKHGLLRLRKFTSRPPSYVFNMLKQLGILKYRVRCKRMEATLQYILRTVERMSKLWKTEARGDRRAYKQ